jgi:hypothetical protein
MSQHDYNIANQGFASFRSDLNNALSAIQTNNSGTSLPSGAVAGQIWLDTTNATSPTLKFYDGADSISLATINYTANTVDWLDSSVSITGLSTSATGTVLTLSDTATTSSVNLIIDNDKEIRFREATANGTNYVSLSAPTTLSADLSLTLPSADGTSGQFLSTNGSGVLSFASGGVTGVSTSATGTVLTLSDTNILLGKGGYFAEATLTDGATVTWNASTQQVAKLTLGGNRTLSAPTNPATGQFISLLLIQDGTGSRTLTWNAIYEFASDTAPTLTTTASLGDLFTFRYNGTKWLETGRNLKLTLS